MCPEWAFPLHAITFQLQQLLLGHCKFPCLPRTIRCTVVYGTRCDIWCRDSSVSIVSRLRAARTRGLILGKGKESYSSPERTDSLCSSPSLLYKGYLKFFLGVRRSKCEVNHQSPSSAKVKKEWSYTYTPPMCIHDVHRKSFSLFTLCVRSQISLPTIPLLSLPVWMSTCHARYSYDRKRLS